jgi:hypothetical protein
MTQTCASKLRPYATHSASQRTPLMLRSLFEASHKLCGCMAILIAVAVQAPSSWQHAERYYTHSVCRPWQSA